MREKADDGQEEEDDDDDDEVSLLLYIIMDVAQVQAHAGYIYYMYTIHHREIFL